MMKEIQQTQQALNLSAGTAFNALLRRAGILSACLAITLAGCKSSQKPPPITMKPTLPAIASKPVAEVQPTTPEPYPEGGLKAIYMTGWIAGTSHRFPELIGLVDRTEINAVVMDVKDDGRITYKVDVPLAVDVASHKHIKDNDGNMKMVANMDKVMATLKKHNIFPIARIACFRDTPLAESHPETAIHDAAGRVWHDRSGHAWLNPYSKKAWDYNVDIALDALKHGFKEIQFDYVRFPSEGDLSKLHYDGKPEGAMREDQIVAFLKYAHEKIHAHGGWFSADVFGLTSLVTDDEGIGQKFSKVVENVDYLCPMVYPSHYHHGEYGIPNPNAEPYKIIFLSVGDAQRKLKKVSTCKLRPWIQDFTLGPPHYGPEQVKQEIKALSDLGIHEFLLWNASNRFTEGALKKDTANTVQTLDSSEPANKATMSPAVGGKDSTKMQSKDAATAVSSGPKSN